MTYHAQGLDHIQVMGTSINKEKERLGLTLTHGWHPKGFISSIFPAGPNHSPLLEHSLVHAGGQRGPKHQQEDAQDKLLERAQRAQCLLIRAFL